MFVPIALGAAGAGPPVATITDGPSGTVADRSATFSFTADQADATFVCGLDGGPAGDCSSPQGYADLADGPHSFRVRAVDATGARGPADTRTWTVSIPPPPPPPPPPVPETTITAGPPSTTRQTSATFSFTSTIAGATFRCRLDGSPAELCDPGVTYTGLAVGGHSFVVRAVDPSGGLDPSPASWSWTILEPLDTTPPETSIDAGPSGTVGSPGASFSFSSSEPASSFECSLDAAAFAACASPATYAAVSAGRHSFAVRAVDAARNVDPTPATRSWVFDPSGPTTTTTQGSPAAPGSPGADRGTDANPPSDVSSVAATPGDRLVTLRWRLPDETDFARVVVTRTDEGSDERVQVYSGDGTTLLDRRVRNATSYRYLVVAYDRAGNRSDGVHASAMPRAPALKLPAPGARVVRPPRLVWDAVAGARYYNVQLFRNGEKILSAWPTRARFQVPSAWRYRGKSHRLLPGDYRWYVWPGVGLRSKARYGSLLGDSRFVVGARGGPRDPGDG